MKPDVTMTPNYRTEFNGCEFHFTPAQARVLAMATMQDFITLRERLQGALGEAPPRVLVALEKIVRDFFGLRSGEELRRKTRAPSVLWPRQMFCHLARERFGAKWCDLARLLGMDHGAILHSARTAANLLETEPGTRDGLRALFAQVDVLAREQDGRRKPEQLIDRP